KPLSLSLRRQHSCVRGGPAIWNCSRPVLQGQACSIPSEHPMMFGSAEKLPYC
ncbi:Jouberin, partial [Dissostichus eleginoides]